MPQLKTKTEAAEGLIHVSRPIAAAMSNAAVAMEEARGPEALAEAELIAQVRHLTGCTPEAAEKAAAVIRNFPLHWRQWRPSDPWDRTWDVLIKFAKQLDVRAA